MLSFDSPYIFHFIKAIGYAVTFSSQVLFLELFGPDLFDQMNIALVAGNYFWGVFGVSLIFLSISGNIKVGSSFLFRSAAAVVCIGLSLVFSDSTLLQYTVLATSCFFVKLRVTAIKMHEEFITAEIYDVVFRNLLVYVASAMVAISASFSPLQALIFANFCLAILPAKGDSKVYRGTGVLLFKEFTKRKLFVLSLVVAMIEAPLFLSYTIKVGASDQLTAFFLYMQVLAVVSMPSVAAASFWQRFLLRNRSMDLKSLYIKAIALNIKFIVPFQLLISVVGLSLLYLVRGSENFVKDYLIFEILQIEQAALVFFTVLIFSVFNPFQHILNARESGTFQLSSYLCAIIITFVIFSMGIGWSILGATLMYYSIWRLLQLLWFTRLLRGVKQ